MRVICFFVLLFSLAACDPLYHLSYSVKNETGKTVFIKFKNYPDSLTVIKPGTLHLLAVKNGVGFARGKYKSGEYQDWLFDNSIVLAMQNDSTVRKLNTSCWKYKGGLINGKATLILKENAKRITTK